jgi:hypothetical protein
MSCQTPPKLSVSFGYVVATLTIAAMLVQWSVFASMDVRGARQAVVVVYVPSSGDAAWRISVDLLWL